MHLHTFVDLRRRLRSTTFILQLLLLDDLERLYLTLTKRKCICAQVLNCANGCAVYNFLPYQVWGQGLPRTITMAIAIAIAIALEIANAFALRY
jgi:hypothetical protein